LTFIQLFKTLGPINGLGPNLAGLEKVAKHACHEVLMEADNCALIVCD
jgi:hypothetical protein